MSGSKVGIVIPAYNAERFVGEALMSAVKQLYRNVRVYVVDDASTDSTPEIIRSFGDKYPGRIVWTCRQYNRGVGATRQEAIDTALADGCDYIAPLDADDLRTLDSIANQVCVLENDTDAGVCYGRSDLIHSDGTLVLNNGWEGYASRVKGYPSGEVWKRLIAFGALGRTNTIVIRAAAAKQCRFETSFNYFEDVDYLAQIATLTRFFRFVPFKGIVGSYRFHANQSSDRIPREELSATRYAIMQKIALRIFHRLKEQDRRVSPSTRRLLWRALILRTSLRSIKARESRLLGKMLLDFMLPITRLEASYRMLLATNQLENLLGVWSSQTKSADDAGWKPVEYASAQQDAAIDINP